MPVDTGIVEVVTVPPDAVTNLPKAPHIERVCGHPEQQPEFPGGTHELYNYIAANLRIPPEAKQAGVVGRVFISFNIEVTGEINQISVLKGLGFGCDQEAVRMIESMPKWKPGKVYGKPTRVKYNLPIFFDSKKSKEKYQ